MWIYDQFFAFLNTRKSVFYTILSVTRKWHFSRLGGVCTLWAQIYLLSLCNAYSSMKILWNQLPDSFRQPHHSCFDSPLHPLVNPSLSSSPLSSSITPSLFHSRLKTYLCNPTLGFYYLLDCLTITGLDRTGPIMLIILFLVSHFIFFLFIPCGRRSWLPVSFLLHVKYTLSISTRWNGQIHIT